MTGSPTTPGPTRLSQPLLRLLHVARDRRDFTRIDPLDRATLVAMAGPSLAPAEPGTVADRLADLLARPAVMTFESGEGALRQTLSALLSRGDDAIVDAGCEKAMFETVLQTSARLHRSPPGSVDAVDRRLTRLSRARRTGRIFVVVPAVSRLSSVVADLRGLCHLCALHQAILVVDMTQDFGTMGSSGLGVAESQGCLGRIDVLLGDLSAICGKAGGFAAFRDQALGRRLIRSTTARPLLPENAPMILAVLDLITSAEGRHRRQRLQGASLRLHNHLMGDDLPVMGHPSPVIPLRLPPKTARAMTSLAALAGLKLPLIEPPVVCGRAPRWLIRLTAHHGPADIDDLAAFLRDMIRVGARRTLVAAP